jgi:hypothetical protein
MAIIRRHAQILAIAAAVLTWSIVPASAGVCNLTTRGSTCSDVSFGGAIYTNSVASGTFYVDPFLQISKTGNNPIEQGYNTGSTNYQFQQTGDTTNLLLSDVPVVTINGVQYREFLLAINEPGGSPELSLDQLQIFLSPTANLVNYTYDTNGTGKLAGLTAIYDMDAGDKTNWVSLNYSLNYSYTASGARVGAVVYIPDSLFTQSTSPQYVYLYSQFGAVAGAGAGGGLEEWWVKTNGSGIKVTITPEPGSLVLLGSGVALVAARLRKRRRVTAS